MAARRQQRPRDSAGPDALGRAALLAWADLDRFEVPQVPLSTDDGWAAVGKIVRNQKPEPWPPRPEKSPEKADSVLVTRVMYGCVPVAELEGLLDRLFGDDQRSSRQALAHRARGRVQPPGPSLREPPGGRSCWTPTALPSPSR